MFFTERWKVSNYLQRVTSSYDTSVIVYDTNTKTQTGIRIRMYGASKYDIADGRIEGQNSSSLTNSVWL